jgi:LysR family cys regulon transcriptional activator
MNLQQLRALCEVIDRGLNISEASHALHRTQPSITRQLQEFEKELGFELFVRRRNRLLAVTPQGEQIVAIARRMLEDAHNMRRLSGDLSEAAGGELAIATTHTQARYTLPRVIVKFIESHPHVLLNLRQGTPAHCHRLVAEGRADMAICTETDGLPPEVIVIPCYALGRSVVTPRGHPLLRKKRISLHDIARYPIITYDDGFSARKVIDGAFAASGLRPNVILSAIDADVSKAYVELGLGIAILATIAFDSSKDSQLRRIDARRLFAPSTLGIVVRRRTYLSSYMEQFMRLFAPSLREVDLQRVLSGQVALPAVTDLHCL